MNVFRKCLRKGFGKKKYRDYVQICESELLENKFGGKIEEKSIYKDMYKLMKQESTENIARRMENLTYSLYSSLRIGKKFTFVFLFYMVANIVLIGLRLDHTVTCVSLGLMGLCFLYKAIEFFSNKYCFIDAYLVMIYKSVLEKVANTPLN